MSARTRYPPNKFPFSDELCAFMDAHPVFEKSLKLNKPKRFEILDQIITSRTPDGHPLCANQVLGLWYLDKKNLRTGHGELFKQDMIVNVGSANASFVSYAAQPYIAPPQVLPIADFYRDYVNPGLYYWRSGAPGREWVHRFADVSDLPPELQPDGERKKRVALAALASTPPGTS